MLLAETEVLGTLYSQMTTQKPLQEIFEEDLVPLFENLSNEVQGSLMLSALWRAFQRGRLYYTTAEAVEFAAYLPTVTLPGLKKYCIALAIRILVDERDYDSLKAIVDEYELEGGDPEVIRAGKITYLWNAMLNPELCDASEAALKSLLGVS